MSWRHTEAEVALVRELAAEGLTDREVAERYNERLGASMTPRAVQMMRRSHGIPSGSPRTCDQWGRPVTLPPGSAPLLSEKPAPGGYVRVKVRYLKRRRPDDMWVPRAVLEWERANGRCLPDGMRVVHANGVRDDDRPENLVAMGMREYAVIHGSDWHYSTAEELRSLLLMARVVLLANDAEGVVDPDSEHQRHLAAQRRSRERRMANGRGADEGGRPT